MRGKRAHTRAVNALIARKRANGRQTDEKIGDSKCRLFGTLKEPITPAMAVARGMKVLGRSVGCRGDVAGDWFVRRKL